MHGQIQSSAQDTTARTSNERQVLDLGDFSKHNRAYARQAFDSLPPGGSLEIVARRKPGQLFFELQHHHGLDFYWWPLERGPWLWRVVVAKPALDVKPTVGSIMRADHGHLDELWDELETAVELCHFGCIRRCVGELSLGSRPYVNIEESLLFPLLEAQTGVHRATARMRSEHRQIERALDRFDELRRITDRYNPVTRARSSNEGVIRKPLSQRGSNPLPSYGYSLQSAGKNQPAASHSGL